MGIGNSRFMRISEIFHSIQGEGILAGVPSAFIRTSGCNLRCTWCDTPYTSWSPEGEDHTVESILAKIAAIGVRHVVLTGGEPLIAEGVEKLTRAIRAAGYHLTIETAATVWKDVVCDLASISPKLSNSTPHERDNGRFASAHDAQRINVETIRRCMNLGEYQLKFVVDTPADVLEIDALLARVGPVPPDRVLLMPEGIVAAQLESKGPWVAGICLERGFRFCPRLHIMLYGNKRGT